MLLMRTVASSRGHQGEATTLGRPISARFASRPFLQHSCKSSISISIHLFWHINSETLYSGKGCDAHAGWSQNSFSGEPTPSRRTPGLCK